MTKQEAHDLLDRYKNGAHYHGIVINQALQCTGDLCRNLELLSRPVKKPRMEALRLVTDSRVR